MTYKEINAAAMLLGVVVVSAWIAVGALAEPGLPVAAIAARMCWAILASIAFNIVAVILAVVVASMVQRREVKDERSDERDRTVAARAMRNAYFVASLGGLVSLLVLAFGGEMSTAIYVLFAALMLAGATDSVSRLIYYRVG